MDKTITFKNGIKAPALGFGTWQLQGTVGAAAIKEALQIGYRHIDTADAYGNHALVAQAILESQVPREELFITTKVWRTNLHHDDVLFSAERFLQELQTDYIDLLLIHWPNKEVPIEETLKALDELKKSGKVKSLGVSNFTIAHLKKAMDVGVEFVTNQVEFHPTLNQRELKDFCDQHKIILTAYSPIGQGSDLKLPVVLELSHKYQKPPSQVVLNWLIGKNMIAIPVPATQSGSKKISGLLDWELDSKDIALIDQTTGENRIVNPEFAEFDLRAD
jgi:2,5-diketo-D-gluconate reductase B